MGIRITDKYKLIHNRWYDKESVKTIGSIYDIILLGS